MSEIKIVEIDTVPSIDPFHADTMQLTKTTLRISPSTKEVRVYQDYDTNSTLMSIYLGRELEYRIPGHPLQEDMLKFLEKNLDLIERIINGHEVDWDGPNLVGRLNDDARAAEEELIYMIDETIYPEVGWAISTVADWCAEMNPLTGNESDEEIQEMVKGIKETAEAENVILFGDVEGYLISLRDQGKDEDW